MDREGRSNNEQQEEKKSWTVRGEAIMDSKKRRNNGQGWEKQ